MDKLEYEILAQKDLSMINRYVYRNLREKVHPENIYTYGISLLFLALGIKIAEETEIQILLQEIFKEKKVINFLLETLEKEKSLINNLSQTFDTETLKAGILFSDINDAGLQGMCSTPSGISKLGLALLDIENQDILLDMGSGVGDFLIEGNLRYKTKARYGIEIKSANIIVSSIRSFIAESNIHFISGDILDKDYAYLGATKVFSNFPLGMWIGEVETSFMHNPKLSAIFGDSKKTLTSDWVFTMAAYQAMKPGGRCVCIMSNNGTWNRADQEVRKMMVEMGAIEGVISLPENLLPYSNIPLTALILSDGNSNIKMLDASHILNKGRRLNTLEDEQIENIISQYDQMRDYAKIVSFAEVEENEYILNPIRYIDHPDNIKDGWTIGELALDIRRGAMIRSNELDELVTDENTGYNYLMLQNFGDGFIDQQLPNLSIIPDRFKKHCITNNSLIVSKISPFKIALGYFEENQQVLATGNVYILEIDEELINPVFMEAFLQSPAGIFQFERHSKGSTVSVISIQDLKKIKIPKLSLEEQNKIAQKYLELKMRQLELEKEIEKIKRSRSSLFEEVI